MNLSESVARITDHLFVHTERTARDLGLVPPPTVWAFDPQRADPFIGYASTRPFYKGRDAVHAIERLGLFPGAHAAPLIMVSWEQADLLSALELDPLDSPTSLVTVVANIDGQHQITLHPFDFQPLHRLPSGQHSLEISWGQDIDLHDADLFPPIAYLLRHWRQRAERTGDGAAEQAVAQLGAEGYDVGLGHHAMASVRPA